MTLDAARFFATVAYPLNEASGNALDAVGSLHLTETGGSIDSAEGGRDFEAADTEYFTGADDAAYSMGDIDFCIVAEVKPESWGTASIVQKADSNNLEYDLRMLAVQGFQVRISSGSGFANLTSIGTTTGLSAGQWYLVVIKHDATNNVVGISLDGGGYNETGYSAGSYNSGAPFNIGAYAAFAEHVDGIVRNVVVLQNRFLTTTEVTELWNGGSVKLFSQWSGAVEQLGGGMGGSFPIRRTYRPRPFAPGLAR